MRIKTNNEIPISTGINQTLNAVVYGEIIDYQWADMFSELVVTGKYYYEDQSDNEIIFKMFAHKMSPEQVDAQFADLPSPVETDKTAYDREVAYNAFKVIFAATYGLQENELTIEQ